MIANRLRAEKQPPWAEPIMDVSAPGIPAGDHVYLAVQVSRDAPRDEMRFVWAATIGERRTRTGFAPTLGEAWARAFAAWGALKADAAGRA